MKGYYVGKIEGVRYRKYHLGDRVPVHLLDNQMELGRYEVLTAWTDADDTMVYKSTWEPFIAHGIEIQRQNGMLMLKYPALDNRVTQHPLQEFLDANKHFLNFEMWPNVSM